MTKLTSITGHLTIRDDNTLISLVGLDSINLKKILYLNVKDNPNLAICNIKTICDYSSSSSNQDNIGGNKEGCNSISEIESACL